LASLQREFQDRLRKYDLSDPKSTWVDDMTKWPPVDLGKIFAYILSNKEFDSDYIGKYKDEKAYSYWKSNFVGTILYADNKDGKCVLQCKVIPSQRIREDPREVWVALKKDGTVLCGWCTCIGGTSATCNHIIASLYKVEYAFTHGHTDPLCTSVTCGWNVSTRRDVQPGKIMDMRIRKEKRTTGNEENEEIIIGEWRHFDPRKEWERNVTDEQKKGFLDGYKQIRPNAQIFKRVESEKHNQMDRPLELTKFVENFTASLDGIESEQDIVNKFLEAIPLNATEVSQIERETKGQSDSFSWIRHRKGRITASNFKDVCTKVDSLAKARGSVKPATTPLVSKLVLGWQNIDYIPPVRWGKEKENEAYNEFYAGALSQHQNCKLTKSALCVLKDKPYIGASPDGIMTCSCCGTTALEIKCPYSIWDLCVSEAWEQTDFLEWRDGVIQLKRSHKYFFQVTGVMAAKLLSKLNFVLWTTKELQVKLIHFDDSFWDIIPKFDVVLHSQGPVRLEEYIFLPHM